ncbi:MAG: S9 family peptidase [Bacteroidales bacterium]|nr:S9 family peptidase [Bacteroidales bacterium]
MKRGILNLTLIFFFTYLYAQNSISLSDLRSYPPVSVHLPYGTTQLDAYKTPYQEYELLRNTQMLPDQSVSEIIKASDDSVFYLSRPANGYELQQYTFDLTPSVFTPCSLEITATDPLQVFIDEKLESYKNTRDTSLEQAQPLSVEIKAEPRTYTVRIKRLAKADTTETPAMRIRFLAEDSCEIKLSSGDKRMLKLQDFMEYNRLSDLSISPSGKWYYIQTRQIFSDGTALTTWQVNDIEKNKTFCSGNGNETFRWIPRSDLLYSMIKLPGANRCMRTLSPQTQQQDIVAENLPEGDIYFSPTGKEFFILQKNTHISNSSPLKRVTSPGEKAEAIPGAANLYLYNLQTKLCEQLTFGNQPIQPMDASADGRYLLFKTEKEKLTQVPFYFSSFFRIDLKTRQIDTLLTDQPYLQKAIFSPSGKDIAVLGSPDAFGNIGKQIPYAEPSNDYDIQLYLFNIDNKKVTPVTKEFDPSVKDIEWIKENEIFITTNTRDREELYSYNIRTKQFRHIPLNESIITSINFNTDGVCAIYSGESAGNATRVYELDMRKGHSKLIDDLSAKRLEGIELGETKPFDFTDKDGDTIPGTLYFPSDFNPNKRYPLIVYYYGGVLPTAQRFDTRYPPALFAAMGYVVYTLNPTGSIGYGQEYSAKHQNDWGKNVTGQIIEGVETLIRKYPYIDRKRIGCLGASFGGFITQALLTQTDLFKAAIAHAGISNIASYWGGGTWGYQYGLTANRNSYPWNDSTLFVSQSPLFHADKIHTPLLLLHGTSDNNVPPEESRQLFTALKLLGREVELIEVENEGHAITNHSKRIKWYNTIFAWFEKYLKDNPAWWNELYPYEK